MFKEILTNIIEVILRASMYYGIIFGGYVLLGALSLKCSVFATEDDTWKKCIKQSFVNTIRMRPPYDKIDDKK